MKDFEKNQPDVYKSLVQKGGWQNKGRYSPEILNHIGGLHRAIVEELEKEIFQETTSEEAPKRQKKEKAVRIISIGPEDDKAEQNRKRLEVIFYDLRLGDSTLTEICASHNMKLHEFYALVDSYADMRAVFDDVYEEYKRNSYQVIRDLAVMQLKKSMVGYNVELKSQSYDIKISPTGESVRIPTKEVTYQKHVTPGRDLLTFALTNREPDEWKRLLAQTKDNNGGPSDRDDIFARMSDEQLHSYVETAKEKGFLPEQQKHNPRLYEIPFSHFAHDLHGFGHGPGTRTTDYKERQPESRGRCQPVHYVVQRRR